MKVTRRDALVIGAGALAGAARLAAPALDAIAGVRLGGAAVDDYGGWAPATREGAQFDDGAIVLDIPGASAALVTLQVT